MFAVAYFPAGNFGPTAIFLDKVLHTELEAAFEHMEALVPDLERVLGPGTVAVHDLVTGTFWVDPSDLAPA